MRTFQWLLTGTLALGLMHSGAPPGSAATTFPEIRGVYVIGQKFFLSNGQLAQAIATPGVDGILVDLDWSDVASATATKTYSWTLLDNMAQLAVNQGKKFEIAIITGGASSAWVFAPPAARARGGQRQFRLCPSQQTRCYLHRRKIGASVGQ